MAFSRRGLPGASAVFLSNPPRDLIGGNFIERENLQAWGSMHSSRQLARWHGEEIAREKSSIGLEKQYAELQRLRRQVRFLRRP